MSQEFVNHMVEISSDLNKEVGVPKKKTEGKIPIHTDDEPAKIAKLTEQDDLPTDLEDEEDAISPRRRPPRDEIAPEEEEEAKIEKEYFGSKGDEHFYMNETESDAGEREDLQIIDAEGEKVFSAVDNELDINDVLGFVIEATRQTDVDEVSRDLIVKYVFPALEEEEEEEEEFPPEGEETIPPKEEFESKVMFQDKEFGVKIEPDEGRNFSRFTIGERVFELSNKLIEMYKDEKKLMTKEGITRLATDILEADLDEKKPVPTCKKCGTKHWPMNPCPTGKKKKAEKETPKKKTKKKAKKESKIKEDLSADVKAMAKEAEAAIKDEDYAKASELVQQLSQVQAVTPKVAEEPEPRSEDELEAEEEPEEREEPEEAEEGKVPDKDDDEKTMVDKLKENKPKKTK